MLGEEALLSWDKFPYTGLSKVCNKENTIPNSGLNITLLKTSAALGIVNNRTLTWNSTDVIL